MNRIIHVPYMLWTFCGNARIPCNFFFFVYTENIEEFINEMENAANQASDPDEKLGQLTIAKSLAHLRYKGFCIN